MVVGMGWMGLKKISSTYIDVSIKKQNLSFFEKGILIKRFSISTAKRGVGQLKSSLKTPLGKHIVRAKIGDKLPIFTVFSARRSTNEIWTAESHLSEPQKDWILSRIIWLSGCEVGINRLGDVDTMQRYIYIHGTPYEKDLGHAISDGCIRMGNRDVIELFNLVSLGTSVFINEN